MSELLTAAQMRTIEQAAIDSGEVTGFELMERAGQGVVEAIFEEWPDLRATSHRAVVLCGPGNNGGDGFVVARLLKEWGWEVGVFLYGDPDKLPPDARVNYERWGKLGPTVTWPSLEGTSNPWTSDLIVDALFGTGLKRPLSFEQGFGRILPEWDLRDDPNAPKVVAVDLPSGLCSDSGRDLEASDSLWADLTVSFHSAKLGHMLAQGPFCSGKLVVAGIGLDKGRVCDQAQKGEELNWVLHSSGVPAGSDLDAKSASPGNLGKEDPFGRDTHKYHHGHALILSGGPGKGGAARLAARGALRIGAGLVTLACPPAALQENAARLDAVMLRPVKDADALADLLTNTRLNALCLGPGLGTGSNTKALVETALRPTTDGAPREVTLDADALTAFADAPDRLFALLHPNCILTPHAGEFARLFPDIAEKLNAPATKGPAYSKLDATRKAAKRAGCTLLFKGSDTVIADQTGAARINSAHYDRAAPWLATAGSGDVLAGFITGLLARGFAPLEAASTAAWLHVECALSFGPGLIAEDLPEELPKVFRALHL